MTKESNPVLLETFTSFFFEKESCEVVHPTDFLFLLQEMINYPETPEETQEFLGVMEEICSRNPGVHFNWNTDISRLLVCRYPDKVTFSKTDDAFAFSDRYPNSKIFDFHDLRVATGVMTQGEECESRKIHLLRKQVDKILGSRLLIGCYGQLGFTEQAIETKIAEFFNAMFEELTSQQIAMVSSGSLLGVSGLGHSAATARQIPTVGIIPESIRHITDPKVFTFLIEEGHDWGDGSFVFGRLPDYIVFAGGGYWSFLEYRSAQADDVPVDFLTNPGLHYCPELEEHAKNSFLYTGDNFYDLFEKIKANLT